MSRTRRRWQRLSAPPLLDDMWKRNKISSVERLRKGNRFLRSKLYFSFMLLAGTIMLVMAIGTQNIVSESLKEKESFDFLDAILASRGMNVVFVSSCIAGAFLGGAFALKFRPTSKSEIIVELSDRIESLEKTIDERHIQSERDNG